MKIGQKIIELGKKYLEKKIKIKRIIMIMMEK